MLAEGKSRREGVGATRNLADCVGVSYVIVPHICEGLGVKEPVGSGECSVLVAASVWTGL